MKKINFAALVIGLVLTFAFVSGAAAFEISGSITPAVSGLTMTINAAGYGSDNLACTVASGGASYRCPNINPNTMIMSIVPVAPAGVTIAPTSKSFNKMLTANVTQNFTSSGTPTGGTPGGNPPPGGNVSGWRNPGKNPPLENAYAPINVSDFTQMKGGHLLIGGILRAFLGLVVGNPSKLQPDDGYKLDVTGNVIADDYCVRGMSTNDCLRSLANRVTILEGGTVTNTCTSFTYNAWTPATCVAGQTQTRTIKSSKPSGCTGGAPVLSQVCGTPAKYTLSVVGVPGTAGNLTLSPTGGSYAPGTNVSISAKPKIGYELVLWSVDGGQQADGRTVNPFRVTMDRDKTVTATFDAINMPPPFDGTVTTRYVGPSSGTSCATNQVATSVIGKPIFEKSGSLGCSTLENKGAIVNITSGKTTAWAKDITPNGFACPAGQVIIGVSNRICGILDGCLLPEHQWRVKCGKVGNGLNTITKVSDVSGVARNGVVFACPANTVLTKVSGTCNNVLCGTFTAHGVCSKVTLEPLEL